MLKKENFVVLGFDNSIKKSGFNSNSLKAFLSPPVTEDLKLTEFLIKIKKEKFSHIKPALIPSSDEYVSFLSQNRNKLSEYFEFLIPEKSLLDNILNKENQLTLVKSIGINIPETFEIKNDDDLKNVLNNIRYPVIIKPGDTGEWKKHFNTKALKAESEQELTKLVNEALGYGLKVILQEIIPGDCTNNFEVSTYVSKDGDICGLFTINKIRQYPMDFGYGCLVETCSNKKVEELTLKFLKDLNWRGFANLEFKFDNRTGEYYFIEVNPRVWQQIELPFEAGKINYPEIYVSDLEDKLINTSYKFSNGIKWIDIFSDMLSSVSLIKKGKLNVKDYFTSFKNAKKFGLTSISDPFPIIKDMNYGLKLLLAPIKLLKGN